MLVSEVKKGVNSCGMGVNFSNGVISLRDKELIFCENGSKRAWLEDDSFLELNNFMWLYGH